MNADGPLVHSDPEIMSGMPVFVGTRVPVKTLLDYLKGGDSLEAFLDDFPTISREQAVAVLEMANEMLVAHAYSVR
jgi:uncharacterized protein (DUF433 family)